MFKIHLCSQLPKSTKHYSFLTIEKTVNYITLPCSCVIRSNSGCLSLLGENYSRLSRQLAEINKIQMIQFKKKVAAIAIAAVVLVAGCKKKDVQEPIPTPTTPTITAKSPNSNATNVALNKVISITFSEAMDASTINATTFSLKKGSTNVLGTVSYSGTTAIFTPTAALTAGMVYSATISVGAKSTAGIPLATNATWDFSTGSNATGLAAVGLGAAGNYVILAKTAINNNPTSTITGDLGISPAATSYITGLSITNATGYATSAQVTGKIYAADMASPTPINLTTAVNNMITAYNDAAGRPSPDFFELGTGNIGGKTLTEGLYKWTNTVTIPTNIIISGRSTDVWIFQIAGNLTVGSGVKITLSGGAQAKNIFWQVAGTVSIGTTAQFKGVVLSKTGITLAKGAQFNGRALAQTAVILDGNIVTKP